MSATWHVDADLLAHYARGDVDAAHAFSVEAHLVECTTCQAALGRHADRDRLDDTWLDIVDTLDAPRPRPIEALLTRIGVGESTARLLATTPSLTISWLAAVAIALAVAVAGAYQGERGVAVFLCIAALAPVAGVAATFGRGLDPTHELGLAAPTSSVRLLLLRTVAVVSTTMALTLVAAVALPGLSWAAAAWLLPALGLTLASLALATYVSHTAAFAGVVLVWVAATIASAARPETAVTVFDGVGQVVFAAVIAVAAAVLVRRREALDGWSDR